MQFGGIGIPELLILLIYPITLGIGVLILYWVIRKAVKAGILDAQKETAKIESKPEA